MTSTGDNGVIREAPPFDAPVDAGTHVFIAYARADAETLVKDLAKALVEDGVMVEYDTASLREGPDWRKQIDHHIQTAAALVVLVTPGSNASEEIRREVALAGDAGVPAVPVRVDDTPLPDDLNDPQAVDVHRHDSGRSNQYRNVRAAVN